MKLMCKLFGHKWEPGYCEDYHIKHFLICKRCDEIDWIRSDLDESENVRGEE
ncbi:DUF1660 family phage protein [Lactococcus lactis]|nr:DUF1660 family phage protein [Lactococcus lactis]MDR7695808.1 DUF1660 family phage protein [Lactococcus lactis]